MLAFGLILYLSIINLIELSKFLDLSNINIDDLFYVSTQYSADFGPLYRFWNNIIANVFSLKERWHVIYINQTIFMIVIPALLYITLRLHRIPIFWTTIFCLLVLSGDIIYTSHRSPLVSAFAMMVGLVGVMVAQLLPISKWISFTFVSLILSYIRPEIFLAFILFLSISSLHFLRKPSSQNIIDRMALISCVIISLSLGLFVGLPISFQFNGRALMALQEHYSVNWVVWNRYSSENLDPWTDSVVIISKSFGDIKSVTEMVSQNPHALVAHIATNVFRFPIAVTKLLTNSQVTLFSVLLFITAILYLLQYLCIPDCRYKKSAISMLKLLRHNESSKYFLLALPILISSLVIYPRPHYLAILVVFTGIGLLIPSNNIRTHELSWILVLGIVSIISFPSISERFLFNNGYKQPYEKAYNFIQKTNIPTKDLFTTDARMAIILNASHLNFSEIKGSTIKIILLSTKEIDILKDYINLDKYIIISIPETPMQLLVHRDYSYYILIDFSISATKH